MDYVAIVVTVVLVLWLSHRFGLVAHGMQVLATTKQANAIAANTALSDKQKEFETQQMAKALLGQFVRVLLHSSAAFMLPLIPLYALSYLNVIDINHVFSLMASLEFIVVVSVLAIIAMVIVKRG